MVLINISGNTNHHVSDHDLDHRRGCRCDFNESKPLLLGFALDDTRLHRLAAPAEQLRRCNSGLACNGRDIGPRLQGLLDEMRISLIVSSDFTRW